MLLRDLHVSLLASIGFGQGVDLNRLEVVQLFTSLLDLLLVRLRVHYEDQGVVVFDGSDGAFAGDWVEDHGIFVVSGELLVGHSLDLVGHGSHLGLGTAEDNLSANLVLPDGLNSYRG